MKSFEQKPFHRFPTGAVRSADADHERWDLIVPAGLRRLAKTCAEGAAKYGDNNWLRGLPLSSLLNHAIRHIYLYLEQHLLQLEQKLTGKPTGVSQSGQEDHLAHAVWNLMAAMHIEERRPDLHDIYSCKTTKKNNG